MSVVPANTSQQLSLQNSFDVPQYNQLFSCESIVSCINDDATVIKLLFSMHDLPLSDSLQERIQTLQKNKQCKLGKKEIKPTVSILCSEVERRCKFLLLHKIPACKSWPTKDLFQFLSSHPLPSSEYQFLASKIEAFVQQHEGSLKSLMEEEVEKKKKLSVTDRRHLRLCEACFHPGHRREFVLKNDSLDRKGLDIQLK